MKQPKSAQPQWVPAEVVTEFVNTFIDDKALAEELANTSYNSLDALIDRAKSELEEPHLTKFTDDIAQLGSNPYYALYLNETYATTKNGDRRQDLDETA